MLASAVTVVSGVVLLASLLGTLLAVRIGRPLVRLRKAAEGIEPLNDIHASAEFRAHLAQVNTVRALELAAQR